MYAQMVETGLSTVRTADDMAADERAFQARIDDGVKIEAKDWMPDAYRKTLIRQISSTRIRRSWASYRRGTGSRARRR